MKPIIKIVVAVVLLIASQQLSAQSKSKSPAKATAKKAVVPAPGKEITVSVKNLAEKNIALFAGNREGLKDPAIKELGGHSTNTLYLRVNDVACIMDDKKKPKSCAEVKATTAVLEVNSSGTVILAK